MLDLKNIVRFLTKDQIRISIEEFLFLNIVRIASVEDAKPESETIALIKLYYEQNLFFGRDLYEKEDTKIMGWNLLIDKLVRQGFLVDYRTNKTEFNLSDLQVTETFNSLIWKDDKNEVWDDFHSMIVAKVGSTFVVNETTVPFFSISSTDRSNTKIKSGTDMVDYFWKNICKNGDMFEIGKFFHHVEFYIDKYGLNKKIVSFLLDYNEGTLKKEIELEIRNE